MVKHVFWQALLYTIFVFGSGLLGGFLLEDSRSQSVETALVKSEVNILDEQLRNRLFDNFNVDCDVAIQSTFSFADSIYKEASDLDDYSKANILESDLKLLQRRYDLLRMMLWSESIDLKDRCGGKFHTLVYLYEFKPEDSQIKAKEEVMSRLTLDLKEKRGHDVLLIPIATDTDLSSVGVAVSNFEIQKMPVIIIDEKTVVSDLLSLEELESLIR